MTKCALCGEEMLEVSFDEFGMRIEGIKICKKCKNIHAPRWNHFDSEED